MIYYLNAPDNAATRRIRAEVADVESYYGAAKLNLGEKKLKRLTTIVKQNYKSWDEAYGGVRADLKDLNKLLEGNQDPTDFPFGAESSSQIDLRLPAEKFRSLRANFRRAVFGNPQLIVAKPMPGAQFSGADRNRLEAAVNWTIFETSNLGDALKDTDLPCFRDGTGLVYGEFVREVESGVDCMVYEDATTFQGDYPDASSAGCSDTQYQEIMNRLLDPNGGEVRVEYDIDFVSKNGPQYSLFPLINFIHFPFFPDCVRDLNIYGYTFKEGRNKFLEKRKRGYYYDNVDDVSDKFSTSTYDDEWDAERDKVEGLNSDYKDAYKFANLIVKADLDNDYRPEVYKVIYWPEKELVIRVERYRIRRNIPCIVPFKFIGRDGRLTGVSLLKDGKDLFGEINALHRHRSNRRRLTDSVTMLAPESMKDVLGDHYQFTPGGAIYVKDDLFIKGEVPRQFVLQNMSQGEDSRDEGMTIRFLEGLMGPSMGMSGQEDPSDPSAPGNKTMLLLQQANYRVADYIDEWKRSIPAMVALHTALLYQNSKSKMSFRNLFGDEESIDSSLLVSDMVKWALFANGVSISPESEAAKIIRLAQSAMQFGGVPFKIDPRNIVNMWNDYVTATRIPGYERYIIRLPEPQGAPAPTPGSPAPAASQSASRPAAPAPKAAAGGEPLEE
jgi:hypothetical protein